MVRIAKLDRVKELYPHIYDKLIVLIPNQEAINAFLEQYIFDERGDRQGFDVEAFDELMNLYTKDKSFKGAEYLGLSFNRKKLHNQKDYYIIANNNNKRNNNES